MAENKMKDVAKLLGLELEEEFKIKGSVDFYPKYKLTERGLAYWSNIDRKWYCYSDIPIKLLTGEHKIIKLSKPILTESEKEYLSAVIKPFRDRILHIYKFELSGYEGIGIDLKFPKVEKNENDTMTLPSFEIGTMYKGMELYKDYTLEELGL